MKSSNVNPKYYTNQNNITYKIFYLPKKKKNLTPNIVEVQQNINQ